MKNSLLWRFTLIITVLVLATVAVIKIPPRLGIDLAGGTQLLYELNTDKVEKKDLSNLSELTGRVIDVLKKRVDPFGQKNIIWRVIGQKRIQIQMPQADPKTRAAMSEQESAWEALDTSALKLSSVMTAIHKSGAERDAAIAALAPADSDLNKAIHTLATANEKQEAVSKKLADLSAGKAPPTDLLEEQYTAQTQYDAALQAIVSKNIDKGVFKQTLLAADNPQNEDKQKLLDSMPDAYPRQKAQIQAVIAAHKKVMSLSGGGVDDPEELQRLVTAAGVLDFRIAVNPEELGKENTDTAVKNLQSYGLDRPVSVLGTRAKWFAIDQGSLDNFVRGGYVLGTYAATRETCILCYDDTFHTLTHADPARKSWATSADTPRADQDGMLVLPFKMDDRGAKYMEQLTKDNLKRPMTILLDDRAISAPTIQAVISDSGTISFGTASNAHPMEAIRKEAEQLKQIMDAGSLPATLQKQPISMQVITSELGSDNIERGKSSAIYAVIAVMVFMFVYYTITGLFANAALMLNLLLVLAAMALFRGTFTLPGIAGLVLTLGMAVDANVLINERIREEIHKGASLWMAIKQGYDKVFWTIFDANLTCSLTSIVLIYFGSEEVKGFGVTLLIGLFIHMFTALFVTRTFMMAAVRVGLLKAIDDHSLGEYLREIFTGTWFRNGHFPFMRVITVTNIDWIGKRHIFWAISAVVMIAGMVAFVMRGEDKYDIEFRGGTQVSFDMHADAQGHFLTLDEVRERVTELANTNPELADLREARIYGTGKPEEHRFDMQTTIKNPPAQGDYVLNHLLIPLAEKFKDVQNTTPKVSIAGEDVATADAVKLDDVIKLEDKNLIRPITESSLDKVFARTGIKVPPRDVSEFSKGTAILLDKIDPPQTAAELTKRIRITRENGGIDAPYRDFAIIPVLAVTDDVLKSPPGTQWHAVDAEPEDTRPLARAVMVSIDNAIQYNAGTENDWRERVAKTEWKIVMRAFEQGRPFPAVTTFDAVVASQAKQQAMISIILSLILIVVYVWIRFGGIWYGIGAIFSLAHDAIVALAATVLSGVIYKAVFNNHPNFLLLSDFKINLTMIAAYLTIIGYSVNDTIVIFDRVRELRGRSTAPLSAKLINDAINQCFGRTIWTTFTVFIVVLIMYIFGGEGVRGFSFAMLVGVITGAYSTLAIASPMLLTTARLGDRASPGGNAPRKANPFLRPEAAELPAPEAAPTAFKPLPPAGPHPV